MAVIGFPDALVDTDARSADPDQVVKAPKTLPQWNRRTLRESARFVKAPKTLPQWNRRTLRESAGATGPESATAHVARYGPVTSSMGAGSLAMSTNIWGVHVSHSTTISPFSSGPSMQTCCGSP